MIIRISVDCLCKLRHLCLPSRLSLATHIVSCNSSTPRTVTQRRLKVINSVNYYCKRVQRSRINRNNIVLIRAIIRRRNSLISRTISPNLASRSLSLFHLNAIRVITLCRHLRLIRPINGRLLVAINAVLSRRMFWRMNKCKRPSFRRRYRIFSRRLAGRNVRSLLL